LVACREVRKPGEKIPLGKGAPSTTTGILIHVRKRLFSFIEKSGGPYKVEKEYSIGTGGNEEVGYTNNYRQPPEKWRNRRVRGIAGVEQ